MARGLLLPFLLCLLVVAPVAAQQPGPQQPAAPGQTPASTAPGTGGAFNGKADRWEQVEAGHWQYQGHADFDLGGGVKLFSDLVDYYVDDSRLVATGNVVFTNQEGRLSAEQVEFNLTTQMGVFHQ